MSDAELKDTRGDYIANGGEFTPLDFTEEQKKHMAEYDLNMGVEGGNSIQ